MDKLSGNESIKMNKFTTFDTLIFFLTGKKVFYIQNNDIYYMQNLDQHLQKEIDGELQVTQHCIKCPSLKWHRTCLDR